MSEIDNLLGPGYARVARARKALEDACNAVADISEGIALDACRGWEELRLEALDGDVAFQGDATHSSASTPSRSRI